MTEERGNAIRNAMGWADSEGFSSADGADELDALLAVVEAARPIADLPEGVTRQYNLYEMDKLRQALADLDALPVTEA